MNVQSTSPGTNSSIDSAEAKPRVLVVEDEVLLAWSIANALRRAGFDVWIVDSGESALRDLASTPVDVVITDVKLPHIDGFEVATKVKSFIPPVPVVVITADDGISNRRLAIDAHVDYVLEKPFDLQELTSLVMTLTRSRGIAKK
jgi:DNA-binding response OmpR family regulator